MTMLHEFRGIRYSTPELAKMSGVSTSTISQRLDRGWTIEQAISIPTRKQIDRGVVSNLPAILGTGVGSNAFEIPEIDSHTEEASQ